jgi:uncharacterized membrane protein
MTFAPLLAASTAIQLHAFAATTAFALGIVQLTAPKGTIPHRTIGWTWVLLMLAVSVSAFFIHTIRLWGPWSPIHLLAIFTLIMLPIAVLQARHHRINQHRLAIMRFSSARWSSPARSRSLPAASCTLSCSAHEMPDASIFLLPSQRAGLA